MKLVRLVAEIPEDFSLKFLKKLYGIGGEVLWEATRSGAREKQNKTSLVGIRRGFIGINGE